MYLVVITLLNYLDLPIVIVKSTIWIRISITIIGKHYFYSFYLVKSWGCCRHFITFHGILSGTHIKTILYLKRTLLIQISAAILDSPFLIIIFCYIHTKFELKKKKVDVNEWSCLIQNGNIISQIWQGKLTSKWTNFI